MKRIILIISTGFLLLVVLLTLTVFFGGYSYRNVDVIKANAAATWDAAGFEIVGYEGYQIGDFIGPCPGGKVWYVVQRKGNSQVRYHGWVSKWGKEYHIYNLRAIDAIAP